MRNCEHVKAAADIYWDGLNNMDKIVDTFVPIHHWTETEDGLQYEQERVYYPDASPEQQLDMLMRQRTFYVAAEASFIDPEYGRVDPRHIGIYAKRPQAIEAMGSVRYSQYLETKAKLDAIETRIVELLGKPFNKADSMFREPMDNGFDSWVNAHSASYRLQEQICNFEANGLPEADYYELESGHGGVRDWVDPAELLRPVDTPKMEAAAPTEAIIR